jgi:hypothetical protein
MEDIVNLFTQEHGVFQQYFKFEVVLFFIFVIVIFSKSFGENYMPIIILIAFGLYITNLYVKVNNTNVSDYNKTIMLKLQSLQQTTNTFIQFKINLVSNSNQSINQEDIQKIYEKNKLDSLYIDSNLIEFLYSIRQLAEYNLFEFYMLLKGTNNILKLKNQIEKFYETNGDYPENINEMFEISLQFKTNCMNNIQNCIYKVPKTNVMYKYIDNTIESYNILINKNIKEMHNYHRDYIRKHGVNNRTRFFNLDFAKDFNETDNHAIIPSKFTKGNNTKLIDLYV